MSKNGQVNKKRRSTNQRGGASDYWNSFNTHSVSPAELTQYTLKYIDRAPVFNPLATCGTIIPTGTSGITPTGIYLATHKVQLKTGNFLLDAPMLGTPACRDFADAKKQNGGGLQFGCFKSSKTTDNVGVTCQPNNTNCRAHYSSPTLGCNRCSCGK